MDQNKPEFVWFTGPQFPEGLYILLGWAGERRERIQSVKPVDQFFHIYEVDSSCLRAATPMEVILYGLS